MLAAASADGQGVRIRGAGTKLGWGRPADGAAIELRTSGLDSIIEHNAGDLTAILEAGVPLAQAQETFAAAGQMLALDPPLSVGAAPMARRRSEGWSRPRDSGPLRHRYGAPRDLIVGATFALSDGSIARSGGKVIKNVAGYDLAKLLSGSFGTLGLILSVSVRLHPLSREQTTALAAAADPALLTRAAISMTAAGLEFEALDVAWRGGRGGILARCAGPQHARRGGAGRGAAARAWPSGVELTTEDEPLWERQRAGQRSAEQAIVRVAAAPTALAQVLAAVDEHDGTLVGRAALGTSYIEVDPDCVAGLRATLSAVATSTVLDAPAALRAQHDPWDTPAPPALALMRQVKRRFDPSRTCNPGLFVGGI